MRRIALMSQSLRAPDCIAFIQTDPEGWIVITTDSSFGQMMEVPPDVEVVLVESDLETISERASSQLRRSFLEWSRGGSKLGQRAENLLRQVKHSVSRSKTDEHDTGQPDSKLNDRAEKHTAELVSTLRRIGESDPIAEIKVFDLFDLAGALEYADSEGVRVSVH